MGWSYQQKPPMGWPLDYDSGLVPNAGLWLFNEGSGGQVSDLSGNGKVGIFSGGTSWTSGKFGSTIDFDGNDGCIDVGNILESATKATVVFRVKCDNLGVDNDFLVKGIHGINQPLVIFRDEAVSAELPEVGAGNTDTISVIISDNTGNDDYWLAGSSGLLNDTNLHQIAVVFEAATKLELYFDGVLNASGTPSNIAYIDGIANITFGFDGQGPNYALDGQIDNVMIFNRALSSSEIALLYREPFYMFKDPDEIPVLDQYYTTEEGIVVLRRRIEAA